MFFTYQNVLQFHSRCCKPQGSLPPSTLCQCVYMLVFTCSCVYVHRKVTLRCHPQSCSTLVSETGSLAEAGADLGLDWPTTNPRRPSLSPSPVPGVTSGASNSGLPVCMASTLLNKPSLQSPLFLLSFLLSSCFSPPPDPFFLSGSQVAQASLIFVSSQA